MPQEKTGLVPGVLAGLAAMLIGAAAYGAVIGITAYEIGFAAIGVGLLVGLGMMAVKPTSPVLPPLAALFGLVGSALGQVIGTTILLVKYAQEQGTERGYFDALVAVAGSFDEIVGEDPKSLLFWAIGAFAGYSFVDKRVKAARRLQPPPPAPFFPQEGQQRPEGNLFAPKSPPQG